MVAPIQALVDATHRLRQSGASGRAIDYVAVEEKIEEETAAIERSSHTAILQGYEVDSPHVTIQGSTYRRVGRGQGTYYTKAGPITIERTLYRELGQRLGKTVDAISLRTGVVGNGWLPRFAEAMAFMLQLGTSREAEQMGKMSGRLRYSHASFERVPHDFAERYMKHQADIEDLTIQAFEIPALACSISVGIDRVSVPMEEPATRPVGRPRKNAPKNPIERNYRMAYCGCVTLHDAQGHAIHTFRYGTMPEMDEDHLCWRMANDAGWMIEKRPDLKIMLLADGAHEMWKLLESNMPEEIFGKVHRLVDFWHVVEKLSPAAKVIHGSKEAKMTLKRWRSLLLRSSKAVETILTELEGSGCEYVRDHDKQPVHEAMTYLENHSQEGRMNYARARRKKLPIGSGNVEATCKCLVETRMKRAGSRWKTKTAEHVLQLRSLALSNRWEPAMKLLHARYGTSVRPAA